LSVFPAVLLLLVVFTASSCGADEESSPSPDTSQTFLLEGEWASDGTSHVVYDNGDVRDSILGSGLVTFAADGVMTSWIDDESGEDVFDYLTDPELYNTTLFLSNGTISGTSVVTLYIAEEWSSTTIDGEVNFGEGEGILSGSIDADGRIISLTGDIYGTETEYGSHVADVNLNFEKR
jgi:hypothetical protein